MGKTISFIVPVYNVERYVERCIESLLHQGLSLDEYEIIIVDDGSTDQSGRICDDLASGHPAIRVIHQNNKGLSEARNAGLRIAEGKYIQFVDSDDYLLENVVPSLIDEMASKDLDVLRFQVRQVYENRAPSSALFVFSPAEMQNEMAGVRYLQDYMGYACYVWQFVFRSSFLLNNALWFMPGIIFEDTEWTPKALSLAERVFSTNRLVYNYLEREGSITQGSCEKTTQGQMFLVKEMVKQLVEAKEKDWHKGMIAHLVISIITTVATSLYYKKNAILSQLKSMDVFPLSNYHANVKARRKIALINLSPSLACTLIHYLNK